MIKLFILLLVYVNSYAIPGWYYNLNTQSSHIILGYGSGESEASAKQEAFNDIAGKISTNVETSMKLQQNENENGFTQNSEFKTSQNANAILNDYRLLKLEYEEGKFYVALSYENIPSLEKFANKVKKLKLQNEPQNSYLKHTLLSRKLKKLIGFDINYQLIRKDKKWLLKYKKITQFLDQKDFSKLFVTVSNKNVEINTNSNKNILYDGDKFYFKVKSLKTGYVTILTVYENGTVATLLRNVPIKKNRLQNIPDEEFETVPEAGLMYEGVETYDLNVVVYSEKKLMFDNFAYADSELIDEEKYKNFDELIDFLESNEYATLKVITKP